MAHLNYVRTHRKSWALSQRDLSLLLGRRSRGGISDLEAGRYRPSLKVVLMCQMLFDTACAELFPELHAEFEDALMRQAAALDRKIAQRSDPASNRKRELLALLADRLGNRGGA
ncbi:MAG TPA: hypothetical protein VGL66_15160 [Caulobacteraceae bacterium]|jgi:DNA-binding XRE family transcriptional regulator